LRGTTILLSPFMTALACALGLGAAPGTAYADQPPPCVPPAAGPLEPGGLLQYTIGTPVPTDGMCSLGSAEDNGGTVFEGNPTILWRFDVWSDSLAVGIFHVEKATGDARILADIFIPMDESATIITGEVDIGRLDANGNVVEWKRYTPGTMYHFKGGHFYRWRQTSKVVQKVFTNDLPALQ
jgi:hypothetical protein